MWIKKSTAVAGLAAVTLSLAACNAAEDDNAPDEGQGNTQAAGGDAIEGSLTCTAEPTEEEMLAYEIPEADENFHITLMQVSAAGYYYQAIDAGADMAAEEAGVEITHLSADGYASPELQLRQVEDAIQSGTDAIVMAPSDIEGSVPVVEAAVAAGLPVVNMSSEVASDDVTMVMQDDYVFGQLAADRISEVVGPDGGRGILMAGPANATWSQRRTDGFTDRINDLYPELEIAATPTQAVDPAEGLRTFEDAFQANPDISWIFNVHYFILPPSALPEEIRGEVIYVGGGYEPDSITGLEDGSMDSVFGLSPIWMGYMGVGRAIELLNGEDVEQVTCVPIPLFTAEDVGSEYANMELIP